MNEQINLTARTVDANHFVFCPRTWEKELKAYAKATWKHNTSPAHSRHNYEIKAGHYLCFPGTGVIQGGFYAAHIFSIVKELDCQQVHVTTSPNSITLETVGGELKTRITLKVRDIQLKDDLHPVALQY